MLKTTISSKMLTANKMLGARMLAANKVVDIEDGDGSKYVKSKTGRSESQNLAKFRKLSKSEKSKGKKSKKLSKSRNSSNFDATEARPSFLTLGARETFNCLWLAFTKALIY